ncbi:unnamed protein product [Paramecium sonneborni]|uniref:Transmembrane protein n=1 Tax=Paramecium sonneborni TaxID=65129 RepID=A0A8S1RR37_9CILI|nr:unnamed protein product [Paramecium sonneborni]
MILYLVTRLSGASLGTRINNNNKSAKNIQAQVFQTQQQNHNSFGRTCNNFQELNQKLFRLVEQLKCQFNLWWCQLQMFTSFKAVFNAYFDAYSTASLVFISLSLFFFLISQNLRAFQQADYVILIYIQIKSEYSSINIYCHVIYFFQNNLLSSFFAIINQVSKNTTIHHLLSNVYNSLHINNIF